MPSYHVTLIAVFIAIGGFSKSLIALLGGWLSQSPKSSESTSRRFQMSGLDDYSSMKQRSHASPAVTQTIQLEGANTPIHKTRQRLAITHRKASRSMFNSCEMLRKSSVSSSTTASDNSPRFSLSSDTTRASVSSAATSIMDDEIPNLSDANNRSRKDSFSTTLTNALADIPTSVADRVPNVKKLFSRRSSASTATPNGGTKSLVSVDKPSPNDITISPRRLPIRRSMTSSTLANLTEDSEAHKRSASKDERNSLQPDITFSNPFLPTQTLTLDRPSRPNPERRPSRMRTFILGEKDLKIIDKKLSTKRVSLIREAADLGIVDERLITLHEVHHQE